MAGFAEKGREGERERIIVTGLDQVTPSEIYELWHRELKEKGVSAWREK